MFFNSGVFVQFFGAFILLYWLVRDHLRARNVLIVAASYLFYGWWNWKFLFLLLFSSTLDFCVGLGLERLTAPRPRRALLTASIAVNLGLLGFFKYYNFFAASLTELLTRWQLPFHPWTLSAIVLPVGISFYTFQSMSYALDVYRRQLKPTHDFLNFLAYVSFFPQLVAGPIQRAGHLLPQFARTLTITRGALEEGIWLILWGLFKKVVVADNLAPLVDLAYDSSPFNAPQVLLGTVAFAFQIYGDFSGYSDIARGLARVLGFDIIWNFNIPYAASNLREFWRRWHISLSGWLRDYLYISLGGNRRGRARTYLNLVLTMLLGGLWHGAAWNYVLWGSWHGIGLAWQRAWGERISRPARVRLDASVSISSATPEPNPSSPLSAGSSDAETSPPSGWRGWMGWALTSVFVLYGWLLFRARSWQQIVAMTSALSHLTPPVWLGSFVINLGVFVLPLAAMEIWQLRTRNRLAALTLSWPVRAGLQGLLLIAIALFWERKPVAFIYFQF